METQSPTSREPRPPAPNAPDRRLACLKDAILEDWDELEATEKDGVLIIRVKEAAKQRLAEVSKCRQAEKQRKPDASPARGLVGSQ